MELAHKENPDDAQICFWLDRDALAKASIVGADDDNVVRSKVELAPAASNPNLPFQVLRPIY